MAAKEKNSPEQHDDSVKSEFIRQFKARPFIFVGTILILVIVIIAFVFVPAIVPEAAGSVDLNFGSYNKIPISYVEGNYFYQAHQSLARQNTTELDETNFQITLYRIWREAFESTVVHTAILDEMRQAGYTPPQDVVDRTVAQLPDFQENGRFSSAKYRQLDSSQQRALWRQIRDSISENMYISDLTWLKDPPGEGEFISAMAASQRSFDMVSFPLTSYPNAEIISFAEANQNLFRMTRLSRITVTSGEREAQQILASIQNGIETFEEAARTKSRDSYAENGGDMGSRMAVELTTEIPNEQDREKIINLSAGALSDVIAVSDNTWAIFRAEENARPADPSDTVIMDQIRNYILNYERGRVEDWFIKEAETFIAGAKASSFDSAAADRVMTKNSFGPLPLNYGDVGLFTSVAASGIPELSSAGSNERFWQVCFTTPLQTPSEPVVIGNSVVVLYPKEEISADEEDINLIKMYYSYWLTQSFEQDMRNSFMTNGKLDDRFWDVFQYLISE